MEGRQASGQPPVPGLDPRRAVIQCGAQAVPLVLIRHRRARRYVLRLRTDGTARVTVPVRGSLHEALAFAQRHTAWLIGQIEKLAARPPDRREWRPGALVHFRGQPHPLTVEQDAMSGRWLVRLATERIPVADPAADLRPSVQAHLWSLARLELPPLTRRLAQQHGLSVSRVTVRNQRSRWGSCSPRRTISLNWRLVQMPDAVRDYVILHELMHLLYPDHSGDFWEAVREVCPDFQVARAWLRRHQSALR